MTKTMLNQSRNHNGQFSAINHYLPSTAEGKHPKYSHLVMAEIEPHCGSYVLTMQGYSGNALISEDTALEIFGDEARVKDQFGYIPDDYASTLVDDEDCTEDNGEWFDDIPDSHSLSYGILPDKELLTKVFPPEGYPIECHTNSSEWEYLTEAINQGIDSHLESIQFTQSEGEYGRQRIVISTPDSLLTLLRRLIEAAQNEDTQLEGDETSESLAGDILQTLGIEWV